MAAVSGGILIEVSPGETRAAIVDGDDRLVELLIERVGINYAVFESTLGPHSQKVVP